MKSSSRSIAALKVLLDLALFAIGLASLIIAFSIVSNWFSEKPQIAIHFSTPIDRLNLNEPEVTTRAGHPVKLALTSQSRATVYFPPESFPVPKWYYPLLAALFALVFGYCAWIIQLLRQVVKSLGQGRPMIAENARRMRTVGLLILFGALLRIVEIAVSSHIADRHLVAEHINFATRISFDFATVVTLGAGLLLIAFAEVFRVGAALQDEQALTV